MKVVLKRNEYGEFEASCEEKVVSICSYGARLLGLVEGEYKVYSKNPKKEGFEKISFYDQYKIEGYGECIGSAIDFFYNDDGDVPQNWSIWYKEVD
jgi:hypothetical protein